VAQHGDVKTRALYKVVSDSLPGDDEALNYSRQLRTDASLYRQFRDGETEDTDLQDCWLALRTLKFNAGYPLLLSAHHKLNPEDQKRLAKALVAVVVRHNIVCSLDRAKLESLVYAAGKKISSRERYNVAVMDLQKISPADNQFQGSFATLAFSSADISIARYLLRALDVTLGKTHEVTAAGPDHVHVEHIYPRNPESGQKWLEHETYVKRLGNLTLLDRRLNEQIKNAPFATKRDQAYRTSRLEITKALAEQQDWSPQTIQERQSLLCTLAESTWPATLV